MPFSINIRRITTPDSWLGRIMVEFNLPLALEEIAQAVKAKQTEPQPEVPPSLLEKAARVRIEGGITALNELFGQLPDLFQQNKQALDEVWLWVLLSNSLFSILSFDYKVYQCDPYVGIDSVVEVISDGRSK